MLINILTVCFYLEKNLALAFVSAVLSIYKTEKFSKQNRVIFQLPGTEYTPDTIKIPTLASSNHSGKGLESRLGQSGVYCLISAFTFPSNKTQKLNPRKFIFFFWQKKYFLTSLVYQSKFKREVYLDLNWFFVRIPLLKVQTKWDCLF